MRKSSRRQGWRNAALWPESPVNGMIWSLNDAESIEYAPESTIRAFDPACDVPGQTQFQLSKFVLFAAPQRAAVVRFLRAFLPDPDLGPITGDASTMFAIARTGVSARSKPTPA